MSTGGPPFGAFLSSSNPQNIVTYGQALLNAGLCQIEQTNGVGLVTRGLCWPAGEIWRDEQALRPITTTWANTNASITTSWTDVDDVMSTPQAAAGSIFVSRANTSYGTITIQNGTLFSASNGQRYKVIFGPYTMNSTFIGLVAQAVVPGNAGNASDAPSVTLITPLPDPTLTFTASTFSGGEGTGWEDAAINAMWESTF